MSEIAPSSFAIEDEIVEESKVAVVEQENLATSPAPFYNKNNNNIRQNDFNAASNNSVGQHNDTTLPEEDFEDEEDLRLHSKSMSRAISDIEELSENSSRVTPKRRKSPGTSQPHTDDDDNESLKDQNNTGDRSRTENSAIRQTNSFNNKSMKQDSPPKFSSPTQNSSINNNNSSKSNNNNNSSSNNKNSSLFSDFSDHSEFELPSVASNTPNSSVQIKKSGSPPAPAQNTSGGTISPPVPALQKHRTYSQDSHVDGSLDDLPPLLLIMECLTDKVKDEESEEVLVLNIDVNTNQANTIIGYVLISFGLDILKLF